MGSDRQKRLNVSVISSVCRELLEATDEECTAEFRNECVNRIMKHLGQLMKFSEITTVMYDAVDGSQLTPEAIDIQELLSDFTAKSEIYLKGSFEINYVPGEAVIIGTVKKLIEFCLTMFIRRAVINGAVGMSLTHTIEGEHVVIHAEITKTGEAPDAMNIAEMFTNYHADEVIDMAVQTFDCEYTLTDKELKLYLPSDCKDGVLESRKIPFGRPVFDIYKNMLSDIADITFI